MSTSTYVHLVVDEWWEELFVEAPPPQRYETPLPLRTTSSLLAKGKVQSGDPFFPIAGEVPWHAVLAGITLRSASELNDPLLGHDQRLKEDCGNISYICAKTVVLLPSDDSHHRLHATIFLPELQLETLRASVRAGHLPSQLYLRLKKRSQDTKWTEESRVLVESASITFFPQVVRNATTEEVNASSDS